MNTEHIEGFVREQVAEPIFVGNDVVSLANFALTCTPEFLKRSYTEGELAYCTQFAEPLLRYASTWAGKEAVYKALKQAMDSTLFRIWWRDIEILREKVAGKPQVIIHKPLPKNLQISLSISHDADIVWAVALVQQKSLRNAQSIIFLRILRTIFKMASRSLPSNSISLVGPPSVTISPLGSSFTTIGAWV
jgi:phosphopantetheine--protein transferase-like protein